MCVSVVTKGVVHKVCMHLCMHVWIVSTEALGAETGCDSTLSKDAVADTRPEEIKHSRLVRGSAMDITLAIVLMGDVKRCKTIKLLLLLKKI